MNRRRRALKRKAAASRMAILEAAANNPEAPVAAPARPTLNYTALAIVLFPLFIIAGITAPIWFGQTLARLLTSYGLSSYITIWLVPGSSILIVFIFWKLYKRLGFQT